MAYTIPSDTHAIGDAGHTVDHNNLVDMLKGMGAVVNVLNTAYAGGADPTGVSDSSAAFNAAIGALPAAGGVVRVPAGTYRLNSTVTATVAVTATIMIIGDGYQATVLNSYVTGDCIRMRGTTSTNASWRSGVQNLCIDGTHAGTGSSGIHVGDMGILKLDVLVQHFNGTGGIGINFDNSVTWTEETDVRALLIDCTQHAVFQVTTGYQSFGYGNYDFTIIAGSNQQDGVAILNGAGLYHGSLRIRGNFTGGASATTAAVVRMAGAAPGGPNVGVTTLLDAMHLDIQVECAAGTNAPRTWYMDPVNYAFVGGCYGILDYNFGARAFASATAFTGQIVFAGLISGDTALAPAGTNSGGGLYWRSTGAPLMYSLETARLSGATIYVGVPVADFFTIAVSASLTVSLTDPFLNSGSTTGVPQRITIVATQAASGGPFTLTWPHPGSPTTAAPTVKWAGGTAPTMSTAANAVDVYKLETIDGATWYGQAIQNVS